MTPEKKYWFPAKRYGWGWGPPATWQGWLVLAVFGGLAIASVVVFPPTEAPTAFVLSNCVIAVAFVATCWRTGEPPRWRWGSKDRD